MASKITVTKFDLATVPGVNQSCTIQHKLGSAPDVPGSWITDTTTAVVLPTGFLSPAYVITGLLNNTDYNVRGINNCNPLFVDTVTVHTPLPTCVAISDIIATGSLE